MRFACRLSITISFVLIAFLLTTLNSGAQVIQRNLLQPFVADLRSELIRQEVWKPFPQSPSAWREALPDTVLQKMVKAGEAALSFEFRAIPATLTMEYVRDGNRTRYEKASFEKRNALWELVLAESVEGKGRFTDQILNGVWSICEESYWGLPAHLGLQKAGSGLPDMEDPTVDLFTAETAAVMAWTDYFAGPSLEKISRLIRPRIYHEVNRRVFIPMLTAKYGYLGGGRADAKLNNWAPWVMSNYCAAALLLEKDGDRRAQAVQLAMHYTDLYIDGLGEDGGCDEGPGYWTAAGGCVFDVLNLLSDASGGKINVYHQPIIQKMGAYIYKTHIAKKYFINVADAAPQLVPDAVMLYRFGHSIGDSTMMGFGSWLYEQYYAGHASYEQFHRTRILYDLAAVGECRRYPAVEPRVKDAWFSDVQLMVSRNNNGLFVASHAGNNGESHNHNDIGDLIVYAEGDPVIIDIGSGTYTSRTFSSHRYDLWFNTSAYHNLPVINGFQQPEGRQYAASDVRYGSDGKSASLTMDLTAAYPKEAGIGDWQRTVRIDKKEGIKGKRAGITVTDKFTMKTPLKSLTQTFMTVCKPALTNPGTISFVTENNRQVSLDYDAQAWSVTTETMELTSPEDQNVKLHWDGRTIYRVLMTARKLNAKGTFTWSIY
ncbi:MAG TPA: heparinase II/III family protein [Puia sp.]|nr:heparinase II/III family protein [Puia sp.]